MRVDPGGPAADRRKLTRHRGWCGEAKPGLTSALLRRGMSLEVAAVPRRQLLKPCLPRRGCDCHGQGLAARYVCTFPTIGLIVGAPRRLCLHNAPNLDESLQAQPGGIGACSEALAGGFEHAWAVRIQLGEALRACGGHLLRLKVHLEPRP